MEKPLPKCSIIPFKARPDLAERAPDAHQFAVVEEDAAIRALELRDTAIVVMPLERGSAADERSLDQKTEKFAKNIDLPIVLE